MKLFSKMALTATALASVISIAGVAATWKYAEAPVDSIGAETGLIVNGFVYTPEEMPDIEVTAVQRLSDVLNKKFTSNTVDDSLDFLLNETIQVHWNGDPTQDPYVGSMDNEYKDEVEELFGDVLELKTEDGKEGVKFILKNQDLNGDGYREIAMYSTADPLDNTSSEYKGVVCVYVTVFTPMLDNLGNIIGYKQVCESLRGYCYEIYYSPSYQVPSFSTDEWRSQVGYGNNNRVISETEIQETLANEGKEVAFGLYNLSYKPSGSWWSYTTKPVGNTLSQELAGQF